MPNRPVEYGYPEVVRLAPGSIGARCEECGGAGGQVLESGGVTGRCATCNGCGYLGLNPHSPTTAVPGSISKIIALQSRYASGVSLWHPRDFSNRIGLTAYEDMRCV